MELHAVELALQIGNRRLRRVGGVGETHEAFGQRLDRIPMAHPHRRTVVDVGQKIRWVIDLKGCLAVFGLAGGRFDHSTQLLHHQLHAVTDAQHRDIQVPDLRITQRRMIRVNGTGATAENDSPGCDPPQLLC